MKYGLPDTAIARIQGVLSSFPDIERAILYGSRAKGTEKRGSDIDLALCGKSLTDDQRNAISSQLDDLLLPYTIDLLLFDSLPDADVREHIERVGAVFYERQSQTAK